MSQSSVATGTEVLVVICTTSARSAPPDADVCTLRAAHLPPPQCAPQNVVCRIAAMLLALAEPDANTPAGESPHRMPLDLLMLAVRRQDPVACNRAGERL